MGISVPILTMTLNSQNAMLSVINSEQFSFRAVPYVDDVPCRERLGRAPRLVQQQASRLR